MILRHGTPNFWRANVTVPNVMWHQCSKFKGCRDYLPEEVSGLSSGTSPWGRALERLCRRSMKLLGCSQTSLILKELSVFLTFLRIEEIYTSFIFEGLSKRRTIKNNERWRRESEQYCQGNWPKKCKYPVGCCEFLKPQKKNPASKLAFWKYCRKIYFLHPFQWFLMVRLYCQGLNTDLQIKNTVRYTFLRETIFSHISVQLTQPKWLRKMYLKLFASFEFLL